MKRVNGTGGLYQRGDGLWIGSVTLPATDGRQRRKTVSSRDRNEAIRKLQALQRDVAKGKVSYAPSMTVEKWMSYWLSRIVKPALKPGSLRDYESNTRLYVLPYVGGVQLNRLTPAHVRDVISAVQAAKGTRCAQKAHEMLRGALNAAIADGLLDRNVAAVVPHPAHLAPEIEPFTIDQVKHILATAEKFNLRPTRWLAAFLTGLRQGELLGMEWDRVDLDAGSMAVTWQLQPLQKTHGCGAQTEGVWPCLYTRAAFCPKARWDLPAGYKVRECHRSLCWVPPKSAARSHHDVPIIPELMEALKALRDNDSGPNPHNLVWHHSDGRPYHPRTDDSEWRLLLEHAGIEHTKGHTIRHTVVSLLQERGVDEQTRMAITGHSTVAAHRGYVHVSRQHAAQAASVLADLTR